MTASGATLTTVIAGLVHPECPRWRDGRLWLSDMFGDRVISITEGGTIDTSIDVAGGPGGLGWLPDGRLVIATLQDGQLLAWDGTSVSNLADLSTYSGFNKFENVILNDMVITDVGDLYVGIYGLGENNDDTGILLRRPDGSIEIVATGLGLANGIVVSLDGKTLLVCETFAAQISAFDIQQDGRLTNRRVFLSLPGSSPDGACVDAEGALWFASAFQGEVIRVSADGKTLLDRINLGRFVFAPALGGRDGTTLFLATADSTREGMLVGNSKGFVQATEVSVPAATWH